MNKTWITLIVVAVVSTLVVVGYNFYLSITGQNNQFVRPTKPNIEPNIGVEQLTYIKSLESYVLVGNDELDR